MLFWGWLHSVFACLHNHINEEKKSIQLFHPTHSSEKHWVKVHQRWPVSLCSLSLPKTSGLFQTIVSFIDLIVSCVGLRSLANGNRSWWGLATCYALGHDWHFIICISNYWFTPPLMVSEDLYRLCSNVKMWPRFLLFQLKQKTLRFDFKKWL